MANCLQDHKRAFSLKKRTCNNVTRRIDVIATGLGKSRYIVARTGRTEGERLPVSSFSLLRGGKVAFRLDLANRIIIEE